MQILNKDKTIAYFQEVLKYDDKKAQIYAYKINQTLVSGLYMIPAVIIAILTHTLDLFVIALLAGKLIRKNIGGIHIKSSLLCFILSFLIIETSVWVAYFVTINHITTALLGILDFLIWFMYVPKGTAQVPLRSKKKILKMRISSGILILCTFCFKIIVGETYCDVIIITVSLMLLSVLPFCYKIFKISYDRNL